MRGVSCCGVEETADETGVDDVANLGGLFGGVGAGFLSFLAGRGERPAGRGRAVPGKGLDWPDEDIYKRSKCRKLLEIGEKAASVCPSVPNGAN